MGELEIDFVRISHQKDAFDKRDPQWAYVVKAIRGDGPLRPNIAKGWGYEMNVSPLARLFAGYRTARVCGLRHLVPGDTSGQGINAECTRWADQFRAGDPEYQTDEKWYEAVLIAEEARKRPSSKSKEEVEEGAGPAPFSTEEAPEEEVVPPGTAQEKPPLFEDDASISGSYELKEMVGSPSMEVRSRRLVEGQLENSQAVRFTVHRNEAIFEYNPADQYFESSLATPSDCLIRELSYQLLSRSQESQGTWPITRVEYELRKRYFSDTLVDVDELGKYASAFVDELREFLLEELPDRAPIDRSILSDSDLDVIRTRLVIQGQAGEESVNEVISSGQFPRYLGRDFLPKAVRWWPELILDGHFLSVAYETVAEPVKQSVLEQVASALRDVVWLCEQATLPGLNQQQWREQLSRATASLHLLQLWRS